MSRDPLLRLGDILESIEWIESHVAGYDFVRFSADRKTIDAFTRCLEVIGEAAKHLLTRSVYITISRDSLAGYLWFS